MSLTSCEKEPMSFGVIAFQDNDDYYCRREAIITNTCTNRIITFTVEMRSKISKYKSSTELVVLPGATRLIGQSCNLDFEIKGAFYEKENSKRVNTDE
jgi:hypothetical protein